MKNNLLDSFFSPSQTAIVIIVAVIGVALIVLNVVLAYVFNKRGERKLYDLMLQHQRELLLKELNDMRENGISEETAERTMRPFFTVPKGMIVEEPAEEEQAVAQTEEAQTVPEEPADEIIPEEPEEVEEAEEAEDLIVVTAEDVDENAEVAEEIVINGRVVRYNRSFEARIIQSSDEVKERYSALKNHILSYTNVKGRISWKRETFRIGRSTFASFVVRGKTLCMCLATNASRFEETKYKVIDLSVRSPKNKLPCMYRISSDRRVKYGKELIDLLMAEMGVPKNEAYVEEPFKPRYESTGRLIKRELIKLIGADAEDELALAEEDENTETAEEIVTADGTVIRFNRSFEARLIQGSEELKKRYTALKNAILSYKGVACRMSWKREAFRLGRNTLASFVVRGKTLCLCLATDPSRFEGTKYKVLDLSVRSPKSKQPCMYRITSDRKAKYASELIDVVFGEAGAVKFERENEEYPMPFETLEQLIERGLIRQVEGKPRPIPVKEVKASEEPSEAAATEEAQSEEHKE